MAGSSRARLWAGWLGLLFLGLRRQTRSYPGLGRIILCSTLALHIVIGFVWFCPGNRRHHNCLFVDNNRRDFSLNRFVEARPNLVRFLYRRPVLNPENSKARSAVRSPQGAITQGWRRLPITHPNFDIGAICWIEHLGPARRVHSLAPIPNAWRRNSTRFGRRGWSGTRMTFRWCAN